MRLLVILLIATMTAACSPRQALILDSPIVGEVQLEMGSSWLDSTTYWVKTRYQGPLAQIYRGENFRTYKVWEFSPWVQFRATGPGANPETLLELLEDVAITGGAVIARYGDTLKPDDIIVWPMYADPAGTGTFLGEPIQPSLLITPLKPLKGESVALPVYYDEWQTPEGAPDSFYVHFRLPGGLMSWGSFNRDPDDGDLIQVPPGTFCLLVDISQERVEFLDTTRTRQGSFTYGFPLQAWHRQRLGLPPAFD